MLKTFTIIAGAMLMVCSPTIVWSNEPSDSTIEVVCQVSATSAAKSFDFIKSYPARMRFSEAAKYRKREYERVKSFFEMSESSGQITPFAIYEVNDFFTRLGLCWGINGKFKEKFEVELSAYRVCRDRMLDGEAHTKQASCLK